MEDVLFFPSGSGHRGLRVVTIIYWAAGWLCGIWLGSILALPAPLWAVLGLLCLVAAVLIQRQPVAFALLILAAGASLGAARYNQSRPLIDQSHVAHFNGADEVVVTGLVVKPPNIRETHQDLTLEIESLEIAGKNRRPIAGRVLVRVPRSPIIEYGTRIEAAGRLEQPASFGTFDYGRDLANHDIYSRIPYPAITVLAYQAGNPIMQSLLAIHDRAQDSLNRLLPQPQAALLSGIVLGDDHQIPPDLREDFRASGMTHIIAISGFNIALIAGALLTGGRQVVGIRIAAGMTIIAVIVYAVFVGAEASVVRAAVMAILMVIAATLLGRPTFLPAVLFSAAFFMTLLNPNILWDVGFQLSFAATLGLTLYLGPWSHRFHDLIQPVTGDNIARRSTRFVSDVVLATFAATIMTFPLMIYHFQTISLVNPLANLLILPAQPGIMTWGGLATIAGMISPLLGQLPAWVAWLFLTYTIELVEFFGSLPFATYQLKLPLLGLVGGYALIFAATAIGQSSPDDDRSSSWRFDHRLLKWLLLGLITLVLLFAAWIWQRPDGKLHVAFLDVGQGDAILIQGPDGKRMLVDGGERPSLLLSRIGEKMPFWDREIDLVVATHPDADHVAGLVDLFGNYPVGQVLINGSHKESGTGYFGLVSAAQRANSPIHSASPGEIIEFGSDVEVEILHAGELPGNDSDNDESIVMRLLYEDFSLLLTGDAGHTAEGVLLRSGKDLQSAVLKAGHHGSNSATSRDFLQAVNPQIVIISGGGERYDHPHEEVLMRIAETGAAVWRTDELGTIELISDGRLIWSNVENGGLERP